MATKDKAKEEKLYPFIWEAKDKRGQMMKGEFDAPNLAAAKAELRRQGMTPTKVKRKSVSTFSKENKKVNAADIAYFSRQMATMMSAGIPLVQAFDIVGKGHSKPKMQKLVSEIKTDVESGRAFADSLAKHPEYFDDLFCNLVAAGEQSGALESMLDRIATYKEKTEALKAKIKKALFYPIAVMVVAFIVTAVLLIFVVPQFESLFKGFGADLPAFTQMVVGLSRIFQEYWYLIFGAIIGAIWGFIKAKKRSKKVADAVDRIVLKLPVIGPIINKAIIARFARTLSTTFSAGVPLVEALEAVAGTAGNVVYYNAAQRIRNDVSSGQQIQASMRSTQVFPNMVVQMVAIGEESGALDDMLTKVADFFEEEVDNAVDALSSLLEPIIMVILGVLVGGLVIAMYLPIFKMGTVV